jgi:protein tyrosine phosphatase
VISAINLSCVLNNSLLISIFNLCSVTRLILVHLSTGIVIVGLFLFFDNVNNQTLPSQLSNYQQVQSIKQQQLIKLQHQLKINEINLVKNIDEVKIFIAANMAFQSET